MAEGEFALVRQHLEHALSLTSVRVGKHDLYAMLADAAAQEGDRIALRQYAPLAEETAARYGHPLYQAVAHRAWGVAHCLSGEYQEARTRLHHALALFEELETRWQIGRTQFELGELARTQGDMVAARHHLSCAVAAFEELEAAPDATRARRMLEALG